MTRPIIVSGSLAFDYIMDFPGSFRDHILPEQLHILNVCFVVNRLEKSWGGTAGNIAYALKMLGSDPLLLSVLGHDGQEYLTYLSELGINTQFIEKDSSQLTAAANIVTDQENNQITTFFSGSQTVPTFPEEIGSDTNPLVLISPTSKESMVAHSRLAQAKGLEIVFDPGQQITVFNKDELRQLISQANIVIGNDYEISLLCKNSEWSEDELVQQLSILITTLGKQGSRIRNKQGDQWEVPACPPEKVVDPTGAGDCFRAGFFKGYTSGKSLVECAQMGSVAATYCIETAGTQKYAFTETEYLKRYADTYHEQLILS